MTRRDVVVDAAIEVLAEGGMRRLTHRAVDRRGGLPPGATSNVFRTRASLVSGVLDRVVERELELWAGLVQGSAVAGGPEGFAAALETLVLRLAREHPSLTAARQAVVADPEAMAAARGAHGAALERIRARLVPELRALGIPDPERDQALVLALLDGLILATLAPGENQPDVRRAVTALLDGLRGRALSRGRPGAPRRSP